MRAVRVLMIVLEWNILGKPWHTCVVTLWRRLVLRGERLLFWLTLLLQMCPIWLQILCFCLAKVPVVLVVWKMVTILLHLSLRSS